jgi:VWFA-related protein
LCAGIAAVQLAAQTPTLKTRTKEQREREYLEAHRITLNVQVSDSNGKLVPDLSASDFTLLDNGQPRKIAGVHMIDGQAMNDATAVVILLDAVNSPAKELEEERQAIFNYLAHGRGPLPFPTSFVLWFNGHLSATSPTIDRNTLGRAFVKATKGVHSNACSSEDGSVEKAAAGSANDAGGKKLVGAETGTGQGESLVNCLQMHFRDSIAALDGIAQQQKTLGGRTILIWAGSGWPLLSNVEFGQPSPKARAGFFDELASLLRNLRDNQVTIDALSPPDETREKELATVDVKALMTGTDSARSAVPASLGLPILAAQTGGRVLTSSRDLTADLSQCIHDADGYYAVLMEAMPANAPHEFHRIELKVKRPGIAVRTVNAYYAEP